MVYKLFHSTEETKEFSLKLCKEMSSAIFFFTVTARKTVWIKSPVLQGTGTR